MKLNKNTYQIMLNKLINFPEELCQIIFDFMPTKITFNLNKTYFVAYYQQNVINKLDFNNYKKSDTYIRNIIRNGRELQFSLMLKSCFLNWDKKVWRWENLKFPSYLIYLKHLSTKYNQTNIRNLIENKLKNIMSINKYKKIKSKNILWSI